MLIHTRFTKAFGILKGGSGLISAVATDYLGFSLLLGTTIRVCSCSLRLRPSGDRRFSLGNLPAPRDSDGEQPCCPGTGPTGGRPEKCNSSQQN